MQTGYAAKYATQCKYQHKKMPTTKCLQGAIQGNKDTQQVLLPATVYS